MMFLLLLLLLVSSSSMAVDPPATICRTAGFFRNPDDCTRFYRCVESRLSFILAGPTRFTIYHFDCPEGTVFDNNIQVCNFPGSAPPCFPSDSIISGSSPSPSFPEDGEPGGGIGIPVVPGGDPGGIPGVPGGAGVGVGHPGEVGIFPGGGGGGDGIAVGNPFEDGVFPVVITPPGQGTAPAVVPGGGGGGQGGLGGGEGGGVGGGTHEGEGDGGIPFAPPGELPDYGDDYDEDDVSGSQDVGGGGGHPAGGGAHGVVTESPASPVFVPGIDDDENNSGDNNNNNNNDNNNNNNNNNGSGKPPNGGIFWPTPTPPGSTVVKPGSETGSHGDNNRPTQRPTPTTISTTTTTRATTTTSRGSSRPVLVNPPSQGNKPISSSTPPIFTNPITSTVGNRPLPPFSTSTTSKPSNPFKPTPLPDEKFESYPNSLYNCPAPGFYPYEQNCHEFYVCQEVLPGKLLADQLYRCPKRYLFDEVTRRCQKEEKVSCTKFNTDGSSYSAKAKQGVLVVLEVYLEQFFATPLRYEETRRRFGSEEGPEVGERRRERGRTNTNKMQERRFLL